MATQPARETWADASFTEGVYTQMGGGALLDWWPTPLKRDGTNLNIEDFKGIDREHQAVHHFVCLWSKGTWGGQVQFDDFLFAKQNNMNKYLQYLKHLPIYTSSIVNVKILISAALNKPAALRRVSK